MFLTAYCMIALGVYFTLGWNDDTWKRVVETAENEDGATPRMVLFYLAVAWPITLGCLLRDWIIERERRLAREAADRALRLTYCRNYLKRRALHGEARRRCQTLARNVVERANSRRW